ncbi:fungal-specific transcription factor domain-containing protein [Mycena galopus ATCC 62051]|nr:fungal-specific transcription factor domain-containing protein [Mycena galopus ATCC 62051]
MTRIVKPLAAGHALASPCRDDAAFVDIADSFRTISLEGAADPGFQGRSSAAVLAKLAVSIKPARAGQGQIPLTNSTPPPRTSSLSESSSPSPSMVAHHNLVFPEDHLMASLISLYFANLNPFLPLLQRPLFLECTRRQLHLHHHGFASILLLVCALGSLYLTDLPAEDRQKLACQWYDQVELCGHSLQQQPRLHDLQAYCLAAEFLYFTSNPRFSWSLVGFGLRFAQDIGAHRQKNKTTLIKTEEELEKRAMWILLMFDTLFSDALGRPRVVNQYDLDIALPCECDDEYWEIWGPGRQPRDLPSTISFFIALITLTRIVQFTLNALYCSMVDRRYMATTDIRAVTAELDAALNEWFTKVPEHLGWDPDFPDAALSDHAAALACLYYHARILVHRSTLTALPIVSLTPTREICTGAARACIRIASTQRRRRPDYPLIFSQNPVFTAGMVLVLDLIANTGSDTGPDLALIRKAINVLESQQQQWPSSQFYITMLERLISSVPSSPSPDNTSSTSIYRVQ